MTTTKTNWTYTYSKDCHDGNSKLWTHDSGASLYIGGWNQGASFDWNFHVIDLTGNEHKYWEVPFAFDKSSEDFLQIIGTSYKGWLSLPFPDFKTPQNIRTPEQWYGIAEKIRSILAEGTDVLVACHGGHGRSGLFCAIVGYILTSGTDGWDSPVEKVRELHCSSTVETLEQEKFVYQMLGLNIQITRSYEKDVKPVTSTGTTMRTYQNCPMCGTSSQFVGDYGMCLGCQSKHMDAAPVRMDLTLEDIKHKGLIDHSCQREKCVGIWKAAKCKHVVHDMIIYEGYCQVCWDKAADEAKYAEEKIKEFEPVEDEYCAICGDWTSHSSKYGICYECAELMKDSKEIDYVHNSITDPYRSVKHDCESLTCLGVVIADVCNHIVHNRMVTDGKCVECRVEENKYRNQEVK